MYFSVHKIKKKKTRERERERHVKIVGILLEDRKRNRIVRDSRVAVNVFGVNRVLFVFLEIIIFVIISETRQGKESFEIIITQ